MSGASKRRKQWHREKDGRTVYPSPAQMEAGIRGPMVIKVIDGGEPLQSHNPFPIAFIETDKITPKQRAWMEKEMKKPGTVIYHSGPKRSLWTRIIEWFMNL